MLSIARSGRQGWPVRATAGGGPALPERARCYPARGRKLRSLPIVPKAVLPSNAAEKAPRQLISGRSP